MGGRYCSLAVGDPDDPLPALGLLLLGYPLHPAGKPDNLRVEHFPRLDVPVLFVSGDRDALAGKADLEKWAGTIPGPGHLPLAGRRRPRLPGAEVARAAKGEAAVLAEVATSPPGWRTSPSGPNLARHADRSPYEQVGAVGWLRLNRPDRLNAMTIEMWEELAKLGESLGDDASLRAWW